MPGASDSRLRKLLLGLVPADGESVGNGRLHELFDAAVESAQYTVGKADFEKARDALIEEGLLLRGKGRGGSVRRAVATTARDAAGGVFALESQEIPADARKPKPKQENLSLAQAIAQSGTKARAGQGKGTTEESKVLSYRHGDKRKNNPQVGLVNEANDPQQPKTTWRYDPAIDPALAFDVGRAQIETLIDEALASGDEAQMRAALEELKRAGSPYLNWAGKAERTSFDIDTVSLHVHERIDPMSILAAVSKRMKDAKAGNKGSFQPGLFEAAFENLPLREAVDFYKHERGWANRLIAGDSLLVMNSLLKKESMAGQVQMIYIDPPYGIKYGSNFQPFVGKRDVKDRKDEDLTQEPEMIKAFRDTWELGIHSYLTYLRDRLLLAKELLHESGSVFVQISDENLHHVRELMDDLFGAENHICTIIYATSTGRTSSYLASVNDYIVWYGKSKNIKYNQLFVEKEGTAETEENEFELGDLTSQGEASLEQPFGFHNSTFYPAKGRHWSNDHLVGMSRIAKAGRIIQVSTTQIRAKKVLGEHSTSPRNSFWLDTQFGAFSKEKIYAVQTAQRVIERCLLMTTAPGDLVMDPTCGSGTTAFAAEKWGRRWITCDTSRVAVTLAKQRLMTASYDYFELRYPNEGLRGAFIYKTVPHVTLKSIADNPEIDEIFGRMYPAIKSALQELNKTAKQKFNEWQVPSDFPDSWPSAARDAFDAFQAACQAIQKQMDMSIAAHADSEILYDQPEKSKSKLRITGPFTVEAVPFATVLSLDEAEQPKDADVAVARSGESARQHSWRDELLKTGIRGKGGQLLKFSSLETLPGTVCLHATGTLDSGERVVVSFGPEHAALEQRQVEHGLREAGELFPLPKMIVFCAFNFDPEAAKDIDAVKGITALKAQMNTDLLTEDLKKARSSNQSFWLMGQPDVDLRKRKDGSYEVEVNGFDYFDTAKGELVSGGKGRIAMWSLDTDYDDRSLFPRQVFFPMAGKGEGWAKLKRDIRAELDESLLDKFQGTVSLPFEAGDNRKIAVKIVDDRGIESLKVIPLT